MEKYDKKYYEKLLKNKKVVAIGETGLDYFHIKQFKSELNRKLKTKTQKRFILFEPSLISQPFSKSS